jgi:DNA-directed RNA polymerase specialized sigma24 family protein
MMDDQSPHASPLGDSELISAARSGDSMAFAALRERHEAAVRTLTGLLCHDSAAAERIVSDTFSRLAGALRDGSGPTAALRPYLATSVRWTAYAQLTSSGQVTAEDLGEPLFADPAAAGQVRSPLNQAFISLAEQYRAALWHTAVEHSGGTQTEAILGVDRAGVEGLCAQARAALVQGCLLRHLSAAASQDCRAALQALRAGPDGALAGTGDATVRQHLRGCPECRAVVDDLTDPGAALRRVVAPLVLGVAAPAYLAAVETAVGGLRWAWHGTRKSKRQPRRWYAVAASFAVLAAIVATGLTLHLTAAASPQHTPPKPVSPLTAATLPPGTASPAPTVTPSASPSRTPAATASPKPSAASSTASPSPSPAPSLSPQPPPRTSSPAPRPTPSPPRHRRPHPPTSAPTARS